MVKKDVILNVFSCSTMAPCKIYAGLFFKDTPIIINVPGTTSADFRNIAIKWGLTGDLFRAAMNELVPNSKDIEIGRRGLTTFSAGWNFTEELFKFEKEVERLDAYILLDGMHCPIFDNWIKFARRAAEGKAFFVMCHSSITPPFISSTTSNTEIFTAASQGLPTNNDIPDYILHAQLPENGVTITAAASYNKDGKLILPKSTKKWVNDSLINSNRCGNMTILGYSGNDRPDHIFLAWYVSKRIWQWLGETWSKTDPIIIPEEKTVEPTPEIELKEIQNQSFIQVILIYLMLLFKKLFGTK